MKEIAENRINAKVVLCKCPESKKIFGVRIEKRGNDWVRTWAFKIDETKAKREGFDEETAKGSMISVDKYSGCPYCGTLNIAQCACGKIFCSHSHSRKEQGTNIMRMTCPWCGTVGDYHNAEELDVKGGGF
jgi:hypothetical protein